LELSINTVGFRNIIAHNEDLFAKNIASEHSNFPKVLTKIMLDRIGNLDTNNPKISIMSCELKYNHPQKGVIRLLKKQYFDEMDEKGHHDRGFFTNQYITHLIKGDFYWIQLTGESDKQKIQMNYRSETREKHNSTIITPREKEILLLIAQGIESCEIAKTLYISNNTVNNHRQNMLNRLGIKDTTALVHLAKLCELTMRIIFSFLK
jgi:DNA-binding CsgD family transcriptional regulator